MIRYIIAACLMVPAMTGPAGAADFPTAQAECNYLAKDYGVSPENMAEFMADCVSRLRPVYEPDAPEPVPVPDEPPVIQDQPPDDVTPGEAQPPDLGQGETPPDEQLAPDQESGEEPEVLDGQAMPPEDEQPDVGAPPPDEAPDDNPQ